MDDTYYISTNKILKDDRGKNVFLTLFWVFEIHFFLKNNVYKHFKIFSLGIVKSRLVRTVAKAGLDLDILSVF